MANDVTEITLAELMQEGGVNINKKFVLINSSMYTSEAFEYILSLIDEVGSVAFISDRRKIYAQGEYYGGDLWEDTLASIAEFQAFTNESRSGTLTVTNPKESIGIKGVNGVVIGVEETSDSKSLIIGYDLEATVDSTKFTIDSSSVYNLAVNDDGQIYMNKYTPASIRVAGIEPIEYDMGDQQLTFNIIVGGTDPLKSFTITTVPETSVSLIENSNVVQAVIPNNTDVTFIMDFSDGTTSDTYTFTQKWGFACVYGTEEPTAINFTTIPRYITAGSINKNLTINQNAGEYGYFACPDTIKPVFTDATTNLQGGWTKAGEIQYYTNGINYNIYRTDNTGLGRVKWIITSE